MIEHITSKQNPLCKHVKKLRDNRAYRYAQQEFLADGTKLVAEALKWGRVNTLILREDLRLDALPDALRTVIVPKNIMQELSRMDTPQGAIAVCAMPDQPAFSPRPGTVLLDGIQDPGNLGTMLRTADAFDVPLVLLSGCADPYGEKTVRASMGAVLRTPPVQADWAQVRQACEALQIPVCATALTETAKDIRDIDLRAFLTVIGSEGQGVRPEILEFASQTAIIPMSERCESLNAAVAASLVMWELQKKR